MVRLGRSCCVFCLLSFLCTIPAYAHTHKLDGIVGRSEYDGGTELISARHESHNDVSYAYLNYAVEPADRSVFVAVRYTCGDINLLPDASETQADESLPPQPTTGVEITVDGVKCVTALLDGRTSEIDHDRYETKSFFSFSRDDATGSPDTNTIVAELEIGVKYWIPYDAELGVRILDCSGIPSNYYAVRINPSPTTKTGAAEKGAKAAQTPAQTSSAATAARTAASDAPKETRQVITAASAPSGTGNAPTSAVASTTGTPDAGAKKTAETTKDAKIAADPERRNETGETVSTVQTTAAAALLAEAGKTNGTEAFAASASQDATTASADSASRAPMLTSVKMTGVSAASVLLTVAVMLSVFYGMRQKKKMPPTDKAESSSTPAGDEVNDDF